MSGVFDAMREGVNMVKMGLYRRLRKLYALTLDDDDAGFLAAAVTNELFSEKPANEPAKAFRAANRAVVSDALSALCRDEEIRKVVTQALRVKTTLRFAQGKEGYEDICEPLLKLKELGILIAGGDAPSPETFLPLAADFLNASG